MSRITSDRRKLLAEGLKDVATVGLGAMLFGQALADAPFSLPLAASGIIVWAVLMLGAMTVHG